jgi:hypothetical protein
LTFFLKEKRDEDSKQKLVLEAVQVHPQAGHPVHSEGFDTVSSAGRAEVADLFRQRCGDVCCAVSPVGNATPVGWGGDVVGVGVL